MGYCLPSEKKQSIIIIEMHVLPGMPVNWQPGFSVSCVLYVSNRKKTNSFNGIGLRTKKDFGDRTINYYYDKGNIVLETDQNNKVTARNIRGLDLLYRDTGSSLFYYLKNAHGDVTQLTNEKGQVIKDYRYDTFGQGLAAPEKPAFGGNQQKELWKQEVEAIDNPFQYCGEYLDEETGNYYLRARYYDPEIQRFINEDSYAVTYGAAWQENLYS